MIPNPLANRLAWRRVVATSPLLRGCTSNSHRPLYLAGHFWLGTGIGCGGALLVLAITALAPVPAAHAQPDDGERAAPRLLIAEMEALTASVGKLSGAVRKADFKTAKAQLTTINNNWPPVRAELQRRGESGVVGGFESAVSGLSTAIEPADQDAASADAGRLRQAFAAANEALGSADLDVGRLLRAVGLPLLTVAALTAVLPAAARRIGVKR